MDGLHGPGNPDDWLRIVNPAAVGRLGRIQHALFDFDGTLSVLRQGWEAVMVPMMVEAICEATAEARARQAQIEEEVRAYVDRSTGILTIKQMEWLAQAVQQYGLAGRAAPPAEYKARYLARLMVQVCERLSSLATGHVAPAAWMIAGAEDFLACLALRGVRLYLASGTDHADVVHEAGALGLLPYFDGGVYGALDGKEDHAKERVIQRILDENHLAGEALLVIGDGPVEIREGARRRALTLGLATDEIVRSGWNPRKVDRLERAGADFLVPDFRRASELAAAFRA